MNKVTADLSLIPIGTQDTSLSSHLQLVRDILEKQDEVIYIMGGMSTSLEGDIEDIWSLIRVIQETLFASGLKRVYTVLKIDDRRDKKSTLKSKENSLKSES